MPVDTFSLLKPTSSCAYTFHMLPHQFEISTSWCNCLRLYTLHGHISAVFSLVQFIWGYIYLVFLSSLLDTVICAHWTLAIHRNTLASLFILHISLPCSIAVDIQASCNLLITLIGWYFITNSSEPLCILNNIITIKIYNNNNNYIFSDLKQHLYISKLTENNRLILTRIKLACQRLYSCMRNWSGKMLSHQFQSNFMYTYT